MSKNVEYMIKILILVISIFPTIMAVKSIELTWVIIFLLIYGLNIRLRKLYLRERFFIMSLLLDLVIIYYLSNRFAGYTYLLTCITLLDGIFYLKKFLYSILLVSALLVAYLIKEMGFEFILLNVIIFLSFVIFSIYLRLMKQRLSEIEYLYDDVRRYSYELEQAKKQIEIYSNKVEHLTQMEERNRISSEIHDTIGHRLTGLLFQMEAGVRVISQDFTKGKELLQASVENLRESIDVLRETVRTMKPKEYKNLIFSIQEMIKKFKKDTGTNIHFEVIGNSIRLYPGVEMVLFKNAQEGLTNAVRHGKAKNIKLILHFKDREVSLIIRNDGNVVREFKKGMGISGMEERLGFVRGKLNIYSDHEFVLENTIPIQNS